jgi:hypothetical protein
MPRTLATSAAADHTDDLDVWSSFAGKAPVWQDDQPVDPHDETGEMERVEPLEPVVGEGDDITSRDESIPLRREPGRITIGTDPTDDRSRRSRAKDAPASRPWRSSGPLGSTAGSHRGREVRRTRSADRHRSSACDRCRVRDRV